MGHFWFFLGGPLLARTWQAFSGPPTCRGPLQRPLAAQASLMKRGTSTDTWLSHLLKGSYRPAPLSRPSYLIQGQEWPCRAGQGPRSAGSAARSGAHAGSSAVWGFVKINRPPLRSAFERQQETKGADSSQVGSSVSMTGKVTSVLDRPEGPDRLSSLHRICCSWTITRRCSSLDSGLMRKQTCKRTYHICSAVFSRRLITGKHVGQEVRAAHTPEPEPRISSGELWL